MPWPLLRVKLDVSKSSSLRDGCLSLSNGGGLPASTYASAKMLARSRAVVVFIADGPGLTAVEMTVALT